jgi:uncharacterized hydrophobic protein (TIGR00271 family)
MFSFLPKLSTENRKLVYDSIKMDSTIDITYFLLVLLAALIATLGLLTNSSAVIIGAMLISPIMNPIIGMSFSMTLGDSEMFSDSIKAIISGTILAITVSVFTTLFLPSRSLTTEILSRTQPTLVDLGIAFASGAAGAYIMCHKKKSSVLPGVAIATAIMPPLCVVGTGLVLNEYNVALGGFLLFLTNLIAINLSSAIVFKLSGFTTRDEIDELKKQTLLKMNQRRLIISITAFILITIPLSYFMYTTISQEKTKKLIDDSLNQTISTFNNVDLVDYTYSLNNNKYVINAVVRSVNKLDGNQVILLENGLEKKLGKPTEVKMKVILDQVVDALTKPAITTTASASTSTASTTSSSKNNNANNQSNAKNQPVVNADKAIEYAIKSNLNLANAHLVNFSFYYSSVSAIYNINVTAQGTAPLPSDTQTLIESELETQLYRKIIVNIKYNLIPPTLPTNTVPSNINTVPNTPNTNNIYNVNPSVTPSVNPSVNPNVTPSVTPAQ